MPKTSVIEGIFAMAIAGIFLFNLVKHLYSQPKEKISTSTGCVAALVIFVAVGILAMFLFNLFMGLI